MDSTTMNSTAMNSIGPTEFSPFSRFPFELRQMVWNEALPTLDIQRFIAEIAPHPDLPPSNEARDLVLCLTPHEDFVQLTKGHRDLLGACRESRMATITKIPRNLPIHYIALDEGGRPVVRFARVPFNPDGQVCISGLDTALVDIFSGCAARGISLPRSAPTYVAQVIQCVTIPDIKNLTITLDPEDRDRAYSSMRWFLVIRQPSFDVLAERMDMLQSLGLVDEGVLNERHGMRPECFDLLHRRTPVECPRDDDGDGNLEFWLELYIELRSSMSGYFASKRAGLSSGG